MTINLGSYNFEGPFSDPGALEDRSGVYVILGRNKWSGRWEVIDVGDSSLVAQRVINHNHTERWQEKSNVIGYCAYYCEKRERECMARELVRWYDPPLTGGD